MLPRRLVARPLRQAYRNLASKSHRTSASSTHWSLVSSTHRPLASTRAPTWPAADARALSQGARWLSSSAPSAGGARTSAGGATTPPTVQVEVSPATHGTRALSALGDVAGLDARLRLNLERLGLVLPTPVQSHALPLLWEGYDVMAAAQTGSGKTLMFALPLLQKCLLQKCLTSSNATDNRTSALIVAPTRELAQQIADVLASLCGLPRRRLWTGGGGALS
ncbi:P-loop containing nucleoside triphosphate hydrolase protein [Pelagophyceae sp. CCMP2097]|nr:P-loop containing nucleoside triphosphate hydrolase protein [Pelagophyceae sp. CCMP2097]